LIDCLLQLEHWNIPASEITMQKEVGQGAFGVVYKATVGERNTYILSFFLSFVVSLPFLPFFISPPYHLS
jgi:hypothetical protein